MDDLKIPVVGFCAYSGTGKTTLLKQLLPLLREKNLHIGVIKHSHHDFEIDYPGKDSYELRHAGAEQMLIASRHRIVHITELSGRDDAPALEEMIARLDHDSLDLILVEGYRTEKFPKIELHRPSLGKPLIFPQDQSVIAVASDEPFVEETLVEGRDMPTLLDLNRPTQIADFILSNILGRSSSETAH